VHFKNATLIYVLGTLSNDYKIPIGLETSSTEEYKAKLDIDVNRGTLRDLLDSITQQEPAYRWEIMDGTINFTPMSDRYGFLATLLDTSINSFAPTKGLDKLEVRNRIFQLPEVKDLMTLHSVRVSRFSDSPSDQRINISNEVDLSISNTNVRGILNKVVRESDYKIWVVDMTGRNKDELIISF
jgi:hypothetical protein